jgi:hypothetical protein
MQQEEKAGLLHSLIFLSHLEKSLPKRSENFVTSWRLSNRNVEFSSPWEKNSSFCMKETRCEKRVISNGISSQFAFSQLVWPHMTHIYIPILTKSTPPNTSMNTAYLFIAVYAFRVPGELILKKSADKAWKKLLRGDHMR